MSPAHVLDPTYRTIKTRLMNGIWSPGYRLDTARLADDLGVSKSPVRDSLNRLAGEKMVDFEPGEGFHVPRIDAQRIRDLFDLGLVLLLPAFTARSDIVPPAERKQDDPAARTATLFAAIASASGNEELVSAVTSLNDRLWVVRRLDPIVLPDSCGDLDGLARALAEGASPRILRDLTMRYHAVRRRNAVKYARFLTADA